MLRSINFERTRGIVEMYSSCYPHCCGCDRVTEDSQRLMLSVIVASTSTFAHCHLILIDKVGLVEISMQSK